MPRLPRLALLLSTTLFVGHAVAGPEEDERARNALRVLTDIQQIPEQSIPDKLLDEGRAIVVIPDTLKAGLVIGGRRGHGLMSVKRPDGTWSNPVFVKLTGGSIGFQVGVQSSDVVLVFRNDRSLDNIVNGKFTLGADAGVAAGPVGRNASAATDGQLKAEIWSWSRARGLFAGVALDGAALQIDDAADLNVYGSNTTPRMIFEGRTTGLASNDVVAFRDKLEEATYAARQNRGTDSGGARTASAAPTPTPRPQAAARAEAPAVAEPAANGASTAPMQAPPQTPPQQGFQPVSEGEIRTESLDGNH
ncbi:lipid-binding SYLF domain-containing protein [Xanthomonas translucens]|uniref:lipid-binding SYLF domain-containing protein n=2 Tax=Xanthomonas campestris pv. translucens TaxID=343 RepID=UPI00071E6FBD|nr:YSC84-related protein [Xanthomonas translucens]KTF41263.1 SH3 domain-containing-like protein 1 [Xanthomonas translucens pv. translucens]KWV12420.1 ligand-binding protein SH3 [Xanthomonas translucens]MCS3360340.1 YSC84-related protein [Xanthomonas translucens pv. translucens]MCS3374136.1 YSC84-related protein [Xanthomonas translucens pv. translucens]MCT8274996.1 YSC84-related protein [Xanthomonas translucens pv. translucens]